MHRWEVESDLQDPHINSSKPAAPQWMDYQVTGHISRDWSFCSEELSSEINFMVSRETVKKWENEITEYPFCEILGLIPEKHHDDLGV